MVNDSNICEGDIISITCSADGKPSVHTYQLFENDIQVPDSNIAGIWSRTMSAQGNFTYRCVANNTVGKSDKNVTVTVEGNWDFFVNLYCHKVDSQTVFKLALFTCSFRGKLFVYRREQMKYAL